MENFAYLIIFSITLTVAHLTSAGFIEDSLIAQSELYYIGPTEYGQIPSSDVENFQRNKIAIYIHGYMASPTHDSIFPVRSGLLASGNYDVIAGDWSAAAMLPYPQARSIVAPVAQVFYGKLLESLTKHNIPLENVICIGHSLGAHVCGNLGKVTGGQLGQILGLDPAKPFISVDAPDCLQKTDALQVVNLHTGANVFGQKKPLGHIDFYSNFGEIHQPGCTDPAYLVDFLTKGNACSHNRACQIAGESFVAMFNFPAIRCEFEAIDKKSVAECQKNQETKVELSSIQNDIVARNVEGNVVFFNLDVPKSMTGTFIFDTYARPPFGMGVSYRVPEDYA